MEAPTVDRASPSTAPVRTISKDAGRPLYVQLYEVIREQVRSGALKPGDAIAAESELIKTYGVSRITVRAALEQLVHDGYIDRHRGRGTFVRATAPQTHMCLASFTHQMLRLGRAPRTEVLGVRVAPASSFGPRRLPFAGTEPVALIERLRSVDGERVALVRSYVPHRVVPGIEASHFAPEGMGQSLLYVLEHRFGVVLDKGEETLVPAKVDEHDAALLQVTPGDAIALKICVVHDVAGSPVLYEEAGWCAAQTVLVQRVCTTD